MTEIDEVMTFRVSSAIRKRLNNISRESKKSESEICREAILAYIGMYETAKVKNESKEAINARD